MREATRETKCSEDNSLPAEMMVQNRSSSFAPKCFQGRLNQRLVVVQLTVIAVDSSLVLHHPAYRLSQPHCHQCPSCSSLHLTLLGLIPRPLNPLQMALVSSKSSSSLCGKADAAAVRLPEIHVLLGLIRKEFRFSAMRLTLRVVAPLRDSLRW